MNIEIKTLDDAITVLMAYDILVEKALKVVSSTPYYASVVADDDPQLRIEGKTAIIYWSTYDSDYYGGGSLSSDEYKFPASTLLLSDEQIDAIHTKAKKEDAERDAKVQAAERAVWLDRQRRAELLELERLARKYGVFGNITVSGRADE